MQKYSQWDWNLLTSQKIMCNDPPHMCYLMSPVIRLSWVWFGGYGFLKKTKLSKTLLSTMTLLLLAFAPGTGIEDFIHLLESQDLTVEITNEENTTEDLKHNGAIKVSRKGQVRIFALLLLFLPNNWIIEVSPSTLPVGWSYWVKRTSTKIWMCFNQ